MRFAFMVLLLSHSIISFGQLNNHKLEITYGLGKSNISNHTILENRYNVLRANSLDIVFSYFLSNKFSVTFGTKLDQRGGQFVSFEREISGDIPPFILGDTILRNNKNEFAYIGIPLGIRYNLYFKNRFKINLELGGYFSLLAKQIWNFDNSQKITLIEKGILQFDYSTFDFGIASGLGVSYQLLDRVGIIISFKYQKGLKDVFADEDIEGYHLRNSVDFGLSINIGK